MGVRDFGDNFWHNGGKQTSLQALSNQTVVKNVGKWVCADFYRKSEQEENNSQDTADQRTIKVERVISFFNIKKM